MLYVLRLTLVLSLVVSPALAADNLESTVHQVMEKARKVGAKLQIPGNTQQEAGMKAARESAEIYHSQEFQQKLQCERQRLEKEVFADFVQESEQAEISTPGKLADNENVYLFFSSSIPDETIHTYFTVLESLEEPNFTLVMKGFVPGEREQYLIRIAKKDRNCVDQLDPENPDVCERFEIPIKIKPSLFDRFAVTQVPAVVYEQNEQAWKITGDMALDYLLEQINKETGSSGLAGLITTLRGS